MEGEQTQSESPLSCLSDFVAEFVQSNPGCSKDQVCDATSRKFGLVKQRSVYSGNDFSVRFSTASGKTFSNVVISLSTLKKYDQLPFVVCVVRPTGAELLLANTTLLKKISHSSHQLRIDNVRGSILGHDIVRDYDEITNEPKNFELLFAVHQEFTWEENLSRLVEATNAIAATGIRFEPNEQQRRTILKAAELTDTVISSQDYQKVETELREIVSTNLQAILEAADIDNINLRGNRIEQIITAGGNVHALHDLTRSLDSGVELRVDVKTKLVGLASNPKCYNIDKTLIELGLGNTVFSLFLVRIDRLKRTISTRLISILDRTILKATRVQFHWAGRNSRGVTQLTGDLSQVFDEGYQEQIDVDHAVSFLSELLDIRP